MQRNTILGCALAALCLVATPACSKDQPAEPPAADEAQHAFQKMSVEQLASLIDQSKTGKAMVYIFDNNGKERFDKGHIPGAKWISPDAIKESDLPADKQATLVFYCASESCTACHDGALAAVKLGYKNVYILPAGIKGWEGAKQAVENS
jgi:rhodanese-related sulfurtransferase